MTRSEATRTPKLKNRVTLVVGNAVVISLCCGILYFSAPNEASAQASSRSAARTKPKTNRPTSRTQPERVTSVTRKSNRSTPTGAASSTGDVRKAAVPQVVATVNSEQIKRDHLARESLRRFGHEVLESMVNKHLIMQACKQQGIRITQKDVDNEIQRIATKFKMSAENWVATLADERNISLEQYRRDIIWPTLALRHLAADKLVVSDEDMKKAFETEYGPKVQVRMISTAKQTDAQQILAQAKAYPDKFGTLAKDKSQDPNSAAARGLIPPIRRHIGDTKVEEVAFALKKGQVSQIIHVANQYLILKCERHVPAAHISPQFQRQAEERLRDRIVESKLRGAANKLFKELQTSAKVVNVYNEPTRRKAMPGVAATINGQQISLAKLMEECMARHGEAVLDSEINFVLLQQALRERKLNVTKEDVNREIDRAAEAYGFVTTKGMPNRKAWLDEVKQNENLSPEIYVRDAVWPSAALKKLVGNKVRVTDQDLQFGFEANYGKRVEVLAIVLTNQHQANKVWQMAKNNPSQKFFGELAEQYSVEPVSRVNFGAVPPIRRHGGQPLIEKEAFSLDPKRQELSGIIVVGDKYVILKCLGFTNPVVEHIEDVRDELVKDIREKKIRMAMTETFDNIKQKAQIDNFLAGTVQTAARTVITAPRSAPTASRSTAPWRKVSAKRNVVPNNKRR